MLEKLEERGHVKCHTMMHQKGGKGKLKTSEYHQKGGGFKIIKKCHGIFEQPLNWLTKKVSDKQTFHTLFIFLH